MKKFLIVLIMMGIMLTGYGGFCKKDRDTNSGSSAPPTYTPPDLPNAPSSLVANAISSSQIYLSWVDNSSFEYWFEVYRKTGSGGTYSRIGTPSTDSYTNTGLSASTTYYYKVRAYSTGGYSSYSNEDWALTPSSDDDAWDPTDDTASNSTWLYPTTSSQSQGPHTLSATDQYDWYRINMTAGRTYYFSSTYSGGAAISMGTGDTYGKLYSDSSSSNLVASDDDEGGNYQFSFSYTAASTQIYYLQVRTYTLGNSWSGNLNYYYSESTSDPVLLVNDGFRPHFSPDGNKIVFIRLAGSGEDVVSNIWVMNSDGNNVIQLTNNTTQSDFSPQWNPNGQRITFLRKTGNIGETAPAQLYDMAADGSNVVLRDEYSNMLDFCHYTRNGTSTEIVAIMTNGEIWLSYNWPNITDWALRRTGGANSVRASADPSLTGSEPNVVMNNSTWRKLIRFNPVNLTESTLQASYDLVKPCLSPSGIKIIAGSDGGLPIGLYLMDLDGSGMVALTTNQDHQPTWYGNKIVFVRVSGDSVRHGNIYRMTYP